MKRLSRYIFKQLFIGFLLILLGLTTLVWLTQSLRMIDMIVTKGISVRIFIQMTLLVLPNFLQVLSPLALFAIILFVFSRMQGDKEITVMQAVGMSNAQITRSVLFLSLILTFFGYIMTLDLIPLSYAKLNKLKWQIRNDLSHLLLQEGQFNSFKNGLTLYIRERLNDGAVRGVMAYDARNPQKISVLVAENGLIFQENNGFQLILHKGSRQEYNPKTKEFSILKFDKYTMFFSDKQSEQGSQNASVFEYSLPYLIHATPQNAPTPAMYRKYKVEIVKRLTKPLYNITFAVLALFGVLAPFYDRRGQIGRINLAVILTLLVQSASLGLENLATKNLAFTPLLLVNIILPVLFVWLFGGRRGFRMPRLKKAAPFAAAVLAVLCGAAPAYAQIKVDPQINIEKDKPVDFEADTFTYDEKNDIVTASGDVVVQQNGTVIKTDTFSFYRQKNIVVMPNKVRIYTKDGTVTDAENVTFSADMNDILGQAVFMRLYEGSLLTAGRLKRKNSGQALYLKKAVYSPCTTCDGDRPLWKITSRNFKHDVPEKEMIFTHSFLNVKDIPVFYVPYLNIPDFTVKRKTGFLPPSFSHGSEMKQGVNLPFFVDIADNQNLTLQPTFAVDHDPLGVFDYAALFSHAQLNMQGSGTRDNDGTNQGHIKANLRYDFNDNWRLRSQYYHVSSDTYFRRYRLPNVNTSQAFLRSYLTTERFGEQNYFNFTGLSFQSLYRNADSRALPVIIPILGYSFKSNPLTDSGLYAFSDINGAMYNNRLRFKSDRISFAQGLALPVVADWGASMDFKATVRGDAYHIDTGKNSFDKRPKDETYSAGRLFPLASAKFSYPLINPGDQITQVFEPIVMLVTSPTGGNKSKIPNIDSTDIDFDDTNLFSENRFVGYDRVETGTRTNYGLQWLLNDRQNRSLSFLFGQSYRFSGDDEFDNITGMDSKFSDYVGRTKIDYKNLTLAYRFRLDEKTWEAKKNEISLSGSHGPLRLGMSYTQLKAVRLANTFYGEREEILLYGSSKLSQKWKLSGFYRYNLTKNDKGPTEYGALLQYDNDCTAIEFDLNHSFTEDRDYKGDTSFVVRFILKTLGQM